MKTRLKKLLLFTILLVAVGMMFGVSNSAMAKTKKLKTKTIKAGNGMQNAPERLYFQGKEEHNAYF